MCEGGVDQSHWLHGGEAGQHRQEKMCEHVWLEWHLAGMMYKHLSNSRLSLKEGRGMP